MNDTVSVDQAMKRAKRMITTPAIIMMLLAFSLTSVLSMATDLKYIWMLPVGYLLCFIIPFIYWSRVVPKWKVWAFSNVRNVHELKKRALREKVIARDGSFFSKLQIWSASDRMKWDELQYKFEVEDEFVEDYTIPEETIISYSRSKKIAQMGLWCIFLLAGICIAAFTHGIIAGVVLAIIAGIFALREYRQSNNTTPQIILNNKGVETIKTGFIPWSDIQNEEAIVERSGKSSTSYFVFEHPGGKLRLQIADFNTNYNQLNKLLILYRGRYLNTPRRTY